VDEPGARPENRESLRRALGDVWASYIKGQFLLAVIVGALTWVVASAIGLRYALVIGLIAGILETVPNFGPIIAGAVAGIVALIGGSTVIPVENWVFALIVIGAFFVIQQLESWIISPYITGKRLQMHPLIVLVSVIGGGILGGLLVPVLGSIIGAYLAVPVIASAREIYRHSRGHVDGEPPAATGPGDR
jgi:predicted PurR-regulated permease PerM